MFLLQLLCLTLVTSGTSCKSLSTDALPEDGQGPHIPPEDSQSPHAPHEDGQSPHTRPEDGQGPHIPPEDSQSPHAPHEDGQSPHTRPEDGQGPHTSPEDGQGPHTSPEDGQGLYAQLTEEEDSETRVAELLGTMKEKFLRKLKLWDVPQDQMKITPPPFMMELYNKYASDRSIIPQSDVIRSFTVQDVPVSVTRGSRSKHRLMFNVTVPAHEMITTAVLQLFLHTATWPNASSQRFQGALRVYEVGTTRLVGRKDLGEDLGKVINSVEVVEGEDLGEAFAQSAHLGKIIDKVVDSAGGVWQTFDVTSSFRRWMASGSEVSGFDVVAEVKPTGDSFSVSVSVGDNTSAALIVFSDDFGSRRQEAKKELKEMILHEENSFRSDSVWKEELSKEPNEHPRRRRRKAEREYCRRTSMKVNFKDIGWDSWIVAPPEYDAFECRGLCYHPLTDESTPSKHALIQTLMNIRNPKKANMACCVPIKLDPITVMYQENGRLTIRYLYEEMKVAECGCR